MDTKIPKNPNTPHAPLPPNLPPHVRVLLEKLQASGARIEVMALGNPALNVSPMPSMPPLGRPPGLPLDLGAMPGEYGECPGCGEIHDDDGGSFSPSPEDEARLQDDVDILKREVAYVVNNSEKLETVGDKMHAQLVARALFAHYTAGGLFCLKNAHLVGTPEQKERLLVALHRAFNRGYDRAAFIASKEEEVRKAAEKAFDTEHDDVAQRVSDEILKSATDSPSK